MTAEAIVAMIGICGLVWGGFATLLWKALASERAKKAREAGARGES